MKNLKYTMFVNLYGLFKIPLVLFVSPRVIEAGDKRFVLKIPLLFRNKNHLGSMYFGALGIGAELSIAAAAVMAIAESKQKIDFVFKDYSAQYLKRADGHVHFICEEIEAVKALIEEAKTNPARIERKLKGYAVVPSVSETEPVMTYELTLSVRNRSLKS
ncbi:DUF4442 domain-containing protein [Bdellovibrio sp. 22V]|uniref:DUF4442 domain-containing protein n=1 Tax=Bdellovibrio TaxID=958 RepID=UPI002542FDF3|nr:DUF4442 domain-containing protein [Bdellovibrio sp. 22V]WII71174.1 DUF4442 domain-containing protein [Bdellovibrio sp. 22V]